MAVRIRSCPLLLAAALSCLAFGIRAEDNLHYNESVGGAKAPSSPAETRPTQTSPGNVMAPEYERYKEEARQRVLDWENRVAGIKNQWQGRNDKQTETAIGELDRAMLTAKQAWQDLRQSQNEEVFKTNRQHLDAAFARLDETWRNDVAQAR